MAIENPLRSGISLKLNAGSRDNGTMIIKGVSLGAMMRGAEPAKIMDVVGALAPILEFPLYRVERSEISTVEN